MLPRAVLPLLLFFFVSCSNSTTVLFAQLQDGSPSASAVGAGIQAAFLEANSNGDNCGHIFVLRTSNSTTDLAAMVAQAQTFVSGGALGFLGSVGSASVVAGSLLSGSSVLNVGPYNGSRAMPSQRATINVRGSISDEVNALLNYSTTVLDLFAYSVVWQADSYGAEGLSAAVAALRSVNGILLSNASVPNPNPGSVGSIDVSSPLSALLRDAAPFAPQAVLVWATEPLASSFISWAKNSTLIPNTTVFLCGSLVGERFGVSLRAGSGGTAGVYVSQVVPITRLGSSDILLSRYTAALRAHNINMSPSSVSLEGYLDAWAAIQLVRQASVEGVCNVTAEMVIGQWPTMTVVAGTALGWFNGACNQGLHSIWLSQVDSSGGFSTVADPNTATFTYPAMACVSDASSTLGTKFLVFGQSAAFTGVNGITGPRLQKGILSAIAEQNKAGGINGYRFHLLSLDDGYVGTQALANGKALLRVGVFALLGWMGTGASMSAVSVSVPAGVPLISPTAGTISLRVPYKPYCVLLRAGYMDETNALVKYLTSQLGLTRLSLFYQDDAFGAEGIAALTAALRAVGMGLLSNGSYSSGVTLLVGPGLQQIVADACPKVPEAVVVWAGGPQAAAFINAARAVLPSSTIYACLSIVGGSDFPALLNWNTANVYVTQIMPLITDTAHPLVRRHIAAMSAAFPGTAPSISSMEGYTNTLFTLTVLRRELASQMISRESFMNQVYMDQVFVLNQLVLGPYENNSCAQGLRQVWVS
eukprot:RCo015564